MLSRAIEAGSRTGMRMRWRLNQLQVLVEEFSKAPKVAYISVIGTDGKILAHTRADRIGETAGIDTHTFRETPSTILTRTVKSSEDIDVFEIMTGITTLAGSETTSSAMGMGRGMGAGHGRGGGFTDIAAIQVGMKMTELKQSQARDLKNAILMFVLLSVVGSAALYFIVFMQNYSAVNYAFQTMKSYTQHVVDSMANGLISIETEGKIVTMNRQAYHILELPRNESVEGKALTDVLTIQECDLFETLTTGKPVVEQERLCRTRSQKILPLSLSASILTDDGGNQLGTVLLFKDLSDVRALQEQIKRSERLASLGKLAAGVAHEIRNPLGALKGFLQYFQRKLELQEQDKTYLTVMMSEVDRLNSVISDLLDFARPKEPVLELHDLGEIIQHVLTLTESDLQAKQLTISLNIEENIPPMLLDRDQLTQVLLNILLNAIHAAQSGGEIRIGVNAQKDTSHLELTISDNGAGISPDDLPKIFDPFFSTKKQGSGLGLAIAYTIIENHYGEITVESQQDKGTTFQIHLPIA